jgi:hypothetical protein
VPRAPKRKKLLLGKGLSSLSIILGIYRIYYESCLHACFFSLLVEKRVSFFNKICYSLALEGPNNTILSIIYSKGPGRVFTPKEFSHISAPGTIGVILTRLVEQGTIRRLSRGIYDYPKTHPELGELYPPPDVVARVIAERDHIRLMPSGAYAANLIGLSEQVPAKVVFLTDGKSRKFQIGKLSIELRRASPRFLSLAGQESGVVIQALRHLGQKHVENREVRKLKEILTPRTKKELLQNVTIAPAWMRPIIKEVAKG